MSAVPRNLWKKYHCVKGHNFSAAPKIKVSKCAICSAPLRANTAWSRLVEGLAKFASRR